MPRNTETKTNKPGQHSTGPRTPAGKAISSQNALAHGLCSTRLFLPGDDPAEFHTLHAEWQSTYPDIQPNSEHAAAAALLDLLAAKHWLVLRACRRYFAVESKLDPADPLAWTEDESKQLDRMLRYKTTAERAFYRSVHTLEKFRNDAAVSNSAANASTCKAAASGAFITNRNRRYFSRALAHSFCVNLGLIAPR